MKVTAAIVAILASSGLCLLSCSQEKRGESSTATVTPPTDTTFNGTGQEVEQYMDSTYQNEANRLAQQIARDIDLNDTAQLAQVHSIHYDRARRVEALRNHYATDTTGQYAALRNVNDSTSLAVRNVLTDRNRYRTYATNRDTYYNGPYTAEPATVTTLKTTTNKPTVNAPSRPAVPIKKMKRTEDEHKVKYANGAKRKVSDDGSIKIKRADGTKIKIDEDGNRTVKKPIL